jgi:hypothetical protein
MSTRKQPIGGCGTCAPGTDYLLGPPKAGNATGNVFWINASQPHHGLQRGNRQLCIVGVLSAREAFELGITGQQY